jgi:hypothetical protein
MATAAQVTGLYQELLGRAPDAGGLSFYQGYADPNAIRSSILGSTEYKNKTTAAAAPKANDNQALVDFSTKFNADQQALLDRQKAEQGGLFDQYTGAINNQEKLPDLYSRLQGELGIPEASNAVNSYKSEIYRVKGLLDRLDEDVNSRAQGTYTTQALRDRISASEGGQLTNQLGRLGTGLAPLADILTGAQGQLSTLLPLYQQQQNKELQPLEMRINSLSDRFAREITGFTSAREQELTTIMDKLTRDRQLSDRDWELAQQLAKEERDFAKQKSLALASNSAQYLGSSAPSTTKTTTPAPVAPIKQLPVVKPEGGAMLTVGTDGRLIFPSGLQSTQTGLQWAN